VGRQGLAGHGENGCEGGEKSSWSAERGLAGEVE